MKWIRSFGALGRAGGVALAGVLFALGAAEATETV